MIPRRLILSFSPLTMWRLARRAWTWARAK